jgi:hypothetical protein
MKRTSIFTMSFLLLAVSLGAAQRGGHGEHGNGDHNSNHGGAAPRNNFNAPSHNSGNGQSYRSENRQNFQRTEHPGMRVQNFQQTPMERNYAISRNQRSGDAHREFRNEGQMVNNRNEFRNESLNGRHEWRDEHYQSLSHRYGWFSGFRTGVFVNFGPPRPLYYGYTGYAPGPGYVWVDGYWAWDGYQYVWIDGYWAQAPYANALWVPGFWAPRHSGYIWFGGYWR